MKTYLNRRKKVRRITASYIIYDGVTLDNMIQGLNELRETINNDPKFVTSDESLPSEIAEFELWCPVRPTNQFKVRCVETDEDFDKRLKNEETRIEKRLSVAEKKAKDAAAFAAITKASYERLKKKFESGSDE